MSYLQLFQNLCLSLSLLALSHSFPALILSLADGTLTPVRRSQELCSRMLSSQEQEGKQNRKGTSSPVPRRLTWKTFYKKQTERLFKSLGSESKQSRARSTFIVATANPFFRLRMFQSPYERMELRITVIVQLFVVERFRLALVLACCSLSSAVEGFRCLPRSMEWPHRASEPSRLPG